MGAGSIQVQYRRGTLAIMQAFVGSAGEVTIETNCKRTALHDGVTPGGWPMHRAGYTPIADLSYQILNSDVIVVMTSLTAARTLTLPSLSNYPEGQRLTVVDGSQQSTLHTITVTTFTASDLIGSATSISINQTSSNSFCAHATFVASKGSTAFTTSTGGAESSAAAFWMRV